MPKLPDYTALGERPSIRPQGGVAGYRAVSGQETAVGEALAGFGETATKLLVEQQDRENKLRAEDAYNKLLEARMQLTTGENGFANVKSGDAVSRPLMKEYGELFSKQNDEIAETLGTAAQKQMFRKRSEIAKLQFQQDLLNHVTREKDNYAKTVYLGTLETETGNAILRFNDNPAIRTSIVRIDNAIEEEAGRMGLPPEWVKAEKLNRESAIHGGVIERMLANDEDLSAASYYERNKNNVSGKDVVSIEKMIEVGSIRGKSIRKADELIATSKGDLGRALEAAKRISNPKVREETENRIRKDITDLENSERLRRDEAFTDAMERARKRQELPPDVFIRLNDKEHAAIDQVRKETETGFVPEHDNKEWASFISKTRAGKLTDMSESEFVTSLMRFDDEHRDRATALRDAARKQAAGEAKGKDFLRNDRTLNQLSTQKAMSLGIVPQAPKDRTPDDIAILENMTIEASKQLEELQVKNKRKATTAEEEQVINNLIMPYLKVRVEKSFLERPFAFGRDIEKRIGELTPEEQRKFYVQFENIPLEEKNGLRRRARQLGVDPSEDSIARAYTMMLTTSGLPSADRRARIDAVLRGQ